LLFNERGGISTEEVEAGSGRTWMDEVNCAGTEEAISDCPFDGWGNEDCSHDEDVGVICSDPNGPPPVRDGGLTCQCFVLI